MTDKASTGLSSDPAGSSVESGLATNGDAPDASPVAAPAPEPPEPRDRAAGVEELPSRVYAAGVGVCTAALATFCLLQADARAPHEDETLALFTGRHSLPDMLSTVLGQRGGAPLHFLLAWVVAHLGGGLVALRLVSAACAVAAVPVVAALCSRLGGRTVGLTATVIVSASWVVLYQAVFGRMYALFLLTSALSYLTLILALEHGGWRRWTLWGVCVLATVASHPYGVLVLASAGLYVLVLRRRLKEAIWAFAAVLVAGTPFWVADLVLSRRFDVGVGGGGEKLGAPGPVAKYLRAVAGDFLTSDELLLGICLGFGIAGFLFFIRSRRPTALLVACVIGVPTVALLGARLGHQASPESRHLIFTLPFLALVVAAGIVELAGRRLRPRVAYAAIALAVLVPLQVDSAWTRTPELFKGKAHARARARAAAADWLARTARPDDVLLGYDPVFLLAWERNHNFSDTVLPRADGGLAAHVVTHHKLGRGVWVMDAGDNSNDPRRPDIPLAFPEPKSAFDARAFGPYLVIRTKEPTVTPERYLRLAAAAMRLGVSLAIVDDVQNLETIEQAQRKIAAERRAP